MSVRLRLARGGAKKRPIYRVVITDGRNPRDGRFIEQIGLYNPTTEPAVFEIKQDRLEYWLGNGAQASETVHKLLLKRRKEEARASA